MTDTPTPTAGAMRAAEAIEQRRQQHGIIDPVRSAKMIDRETKLPEVLALLRDIDKWGGVQDASWDAPDESEKQADDINRRIKSAIAATEPTP